MVQIIENWSCITGVILAQEPVEGRGTSTAPAKSHLITIEIESVAKLPGVRSLITKKRGEQIRISISRGGAESTADLIGKRVTIPVRMVREGSYFGAPDWTLEHGSSRCGPNPMETTQ